MQKAIIVLAHYNHKGQWLEEGMDEVNELLSEGWKVVSSNPMGGAAYAYGYGYGFAGGETRHNGESSETGYDMAFTTMMILESDTDN